MVALDLSKAFDTVNINLLKEKIFNSEIPKHFIKYLFNYIDGRSGYTIYNNKQSRKRIIKTGVPQGGILSPFLFNLYVSDIPKPPVGVKLTMYADDITIYSSDQNIHNAASVIQPYLNQIHDWANKNSLKINSNKSSSTIFTTSTKETNNTVTLTINNETIPSVSNPKILGLTFDPLLKFHVHSQNIYENTLSKTKILKILTSKKFSLSKELISFIYKQIIRTNLEYSCTIWGPTISNSRMKKLQILQNNCLRIATGCLAKTNINHLHNETKILPLQEHITLHCSNFYVKIHNTDHPLNYLLKQENDARNIRKSICNTNKLIVPPELPEYTEEKDKYKYIHTYTVSQYLNNNKNIILKEPFPAIAKEELSLSRELRKRLSRLRGNKIKLFETRKSMRKNYKPEICPFCQEDHLNVNHLFNCSIISTDLEVHSLWSDPKKVIALEDKWIEKLNAKPINESINHNS